MPLVGTDHRAGSDRALDEVADAVAAGATRLLDVGTGTGTLAIAAIRRWPDVRVTAIDASSEMIAKAGAEADCALSSDERRRLSLRVAFADDLGLPDGSIDVAVSSFVLQLVPNGSAPCARPAASSARAASSVDQLARRLGRLAADDDFDDALIDIGEEARDWDDPPNDLRDPAAAVAQMRRAGYVDARARAAQPRPCVRRGRCCRVPHGVRRGGPGREPRRSAARLRGRAPTAARATTGLGARARQPDRDGRGVRR
jgi:SAM-dependent methyltransferase